jgi:hypothetical protein
MRSLKIVVSLVTLIVMLMVNMIAWPVQAEGYAVRLSIPATVENGKNITVTVSVPSKMLVENFEGTLSFDASKVQYISIKNMTTLPQFDATASGSSIRFAGVFGSSVDTTSLVQVTFKAIAEGTASFSVANMVVNEDMPAGNSGSTSVTAGLPAVNTLKSLVIGSGSLTPAFKADSTKYTVTVAQSVTSLTCSAVPTDEKATVSVAGNTSLKEGTNKVTITVKAQNGEKLIYTITVTRTPAASETFKPDDVTIDTGETLSFSNGSFKVVAIPADLTTPDGFYKTTVTIGKQSMIGFKATSGEIVLLYLGNDQGESDLYYYDQAGNQVIPYVSISIPEKIYVLLPAESVAVVPSGYSAASFTMNGQLITGWKSSETAGSGSSPDDTYLLYLLDSAGQKGFYLYKPANQMIFPYLMVTAAPEQTTPSESSVTTASATQSATGTPVPATSNVRIWMIATAVFALLSLLLVIFLVWTYFEYVRPNERPQNRPNRETPPKPPKIRRID